MEALEARELLCANVPCAHSYINLYDYEGNLVDNWYELVNGHHGHHDHDHHDDHDDHDHHEGSALAAPGLLANNGQPSSDEYNAVVKWPQAGGAGTP